MSKTKRTQEEILARIKSHEELKDVFTTHFAIMDLLEFLDYDYAKEYVKESITPKEWAKSVVTDPIKKIKDYMPFAWMKAMDERGLSSIRSVVHMTEWLWLAADYKLFDLLDNGLYGYYGTDALKVICKKYEIPLEDKHGRKIEDHVWEKDL